MVWIGFYWLRRHDTKYSNTFTCTNISHHSVAAFRPLTSCFIHHLFTCIAGAAESASEKQIIHMSSASCLREWELEHPWRQGRHSASPFKPPHRWPHSWVCTHASRLYSCQVSNGVISFFPKITQKGKVSTPHLLCTEVTIKLMYILQNLLWMRLELSEYTHLTVMVLADRCRCQEGWVSWSTTKATGSGSGCMGSSWPLVLPTQL